MFRHVVSRVNKKMQVQLLLAFLACLTLTPRLLGQNCAVVNAKTSGKVCQFPNARCSPVTELFGNTGTCTTEGSAADGQTCECKGADKPPADFTISASPASLTASQGSNALATITITPVNGFGAGVALSESGLPAGVTATITSASPTASRLTLAVGPSASPGTSTLTISGTSGTLKHSTTVRLTVTAISNIPAGFVHCADENQACSVGQASDVAYGSGRSFFVKPGVVGSIACDNATFGDPTVGVVKACYTIPRYSICAVENQTCSGAGFRDVAYSAHGAMYFQLHVSGDVPCNNRTFGDPAYGFVKACYQSTALVQPAWGFADLHSHPASHLAFGYDPSSGSNGLFWGTPGLELTSSRTGSAIAAALPPCAPDTHAGYDGDPVRHQTHIEILQKIDAMTGFPHGANGNPAFTDWPAALSIEHQGMHITEIRRAYEGGLRLLFASTTDNQLLSRLWHNGGNFGSNAIPTPDPHYDLTSAIRQIAFIQQLAAANFPWMQVVTTSAQARQAIANNKLAVVLSLEMDSLYPDQILNLIQNYGVRHVIPVHLSNNTIGGAAAYDDTFNANTYFLTGSFFKPRTNTCVNFRLGVPEHLVEGSLGDLHAIEEQPIDDTWSKSLGYDTPTSQGGHENSLGLTKSEFQRLMRAGVLLDVVHMDEQSASDALGLGLQYHFPLMDSHTGLRDDTNCSAGLPPSTNERSIPYSQISSLATLGGVLGLGTATNTGPDPVEQWLHDYKKARSLMGGTGIALGTDFNGLSPQIQLNSYNLPTPYPIDIGLRLGPPPGTTVLSRPKFQLANRTFDFATDGLANYGMLPDFLQAVSQHPDFQTVPPACDGTCQACVKSQCDPMLKECMGPDGPTSKSICVDGYNNCRVSLCGQKTPTPNLTPNPDAMPELAALFHSAEDAIEMWEKAEIAAASIPSPEGVQCSVFDDAYTNVAGPSDAVFINNAQQACIPGGSNGVCRKWFGRCTTTVTHTPVTFYTFDDNYANLAGSSDAVYIHSSGPVLLNGELQACIPGGANGICHKWFGRGITQDGRSVLCNVFGDGYSDILGPMDSVLPSRKGAFPNLGQTQVCLPTGSAANACGKWFGRCIVK